MLNMRTYIHQYIDRFNKLFNFEVDKLVFIGTLISVFVRFIILQWINSPLKPDVAVTNSVI